MKENIAFNPSHISIFSANTVVLHAQPIAHLVEQLGGFQNGDFVR